MGYTLKVYKVDYRYKSGERLILEKEYPGHSGNAMMDLLFDLRQSKYKPEDGYRVDF